MKASRQRAMLVGVVVTWGALSAAPADAATGKGEPGVDGTFAKVSFDTDGDGAPDVWEYYPRTGTEADRTPARREVDLNHDGKIDVISTYSSGKLAREEMDADFDGRIDWIDIYEDGQRVRSEWDTGFDGKADLFKYFENGVLVRVEQDTNADGRSEYFEYYKDGTIDRFGRDTDGDGKVDQWGGRR